MRFILIIWQDEGGEGKGGGEGGEGCTCGLVMELGRNLLVTWFRRRDKKSFCRFYFFILSHVFISQTCFCCSLFIVCAILSPIFVLFLNFFRVCCSHLSPSPAFLSFRFPYFYHHHHHHHHHHHQPLYYYFSIGRGGGEIAIEHKNNSFAKFSMKNFNWQTRCRWYRCKLPWPFFLEITLTKNHYKILLQMESDKRIFFICASNLLLLKKFWIHAASVILLY